MSWALTISHLNDDLVPTDEVRTLVSRGSLLVRVAALKALSRRARDNEELIGDIARAAVDPINDTKLIGARVSHVAVACLLEVGTESALAEAERIIAGWPESDRENLLWSLEAQELESKNRAVSVSTEFPPKLLR